MTTRLNQKKVLIVDDEQDVLDAVEEEFLDGTVPTEHAVPPDAADPSTQPQALAM